jgi:CubicO group peptidase (beta-lactamase class C family)
MMDRRRFVAALLGAALPLGRAPWSPAAAAPQWAAVQKLLDDYVAAQKIAGAVVALSYGGAEPAFPAAGRIALDSTTPYDRDSICRIYSMTKPVTGLAAMTLIEQGKLGLDQPVAEVIPEWRSLRVAIDPKKGLESRPATRTMTMRHLLTHTSGLSYWTPRSGEDPLPAAYRARGITPGAYGELLKRPGYGPQAANLEEMVKRLAGLPLLAEPGTVWTYSIGLDVMGLVIERVSGKPLDVYLRERIFEPLRMTSTAFHVRADQAERLTTNYSATPDGLKPVDSRQSSAWLKPPTLVAGGAGLVSTARDFARFSAMVLGEGTLDGAEVMRPTTLRLACSNLLPEGVVYDGGNGMGAGMRVSLIDNGPQFGSKGAVGWGGAAGTLWTVEPARRGFVVFLSQFMPADYYPIRADLRAAVEADLKTRP